MFSLTGNILIVKARMKPGSRPPGRVQMEADDLALLSERERQVFQLLGGGLRAGAVAVEMRLSVKTVETHQKHIREKLHLRDGAELQRRATIFHTARATKPAAE